MKLFVAFSTLVVFLAVLLALSMVMAYLTMWFVNFLFTPALLTYVFGAAKITFW